jgi:hypothetical protein
MCKVRIASTGAFHWRKPSRIAVSRIMSIHYNLKLFSFRIRFYKTSLGARRNGMVTAKLMLVCSFIPKRVNSLSPLTPLSGGLMDRDIQQG